MVSCRAFARAVVERGVCSFTALDVNSFDMVCYRHFWRAAWALERGVSSLGGAVPSAVGIAMGRAPIVFGLAQGLEPTFQATLNQRFWASWKTRMLSSSRVLRKCGGVKFGRRWHVAPHVLR